MAEGVLNKIILWALFILFLFVFLFVFYRPAGGLMSKIASLALGVEKYLPVEPNKELKQDDSLPQVTLDVQKKFMQDISQQIDKGECLLSIESLSGLGDFKMEVSNFDGNVVSIINKPAGEGEIKLNQQTSEQKIQFCIIDSKAFYDCYLNPTQTDCENQLYKEINSVQITKDNIIINGKSYDYDKIALFKPEDGKVCFIPTYSNGPGCNANDLAIQDSCLPKLPRIQNCGDTKFTNLQLCQVTYSCFGNLGIKQVPPSAYCNENRPETQMWSEDNCKKVQTCTKEITSIPSQCSKKIQAVESYPLWVLTFNNQ